MCVCACVSAQTIVNASNVLNIVLNSRLMVSEQSRTKSLYQHNCHAHFEKFYSLPSLSYVDENKSSGSGSGHVSAS